MERDSDHAARREYFAAAAATGVDSERKRVLQILRDERARCESADDPCVTCTVLSGVIFEVECGEELEADE